MNTLIKNILAVVLGWIGGSVINMGLIKIGHIFLPITGIDPNDFDALARVMPNLEFKYFIFPFLAHALGTFSGAIIAGLLAVSHKMKFSMGIGGLFLLGGIMVNYMIPGPTWFAVTDIVFAYLPMAWLGGKLAGKIIRNNENRDIQ
ncbi:MAG: hypothetical protein HKP49_02105 [Maribacter sp.]|nr:hypothetical protein [Maribacter sp.]